MGAMRPAQCWPYRQVRTVIVTEVTFGSASMQVAESDVRALAEFLPRMTALTCLDLRKAAYCSRPDLDLVACFAAQVQEVGAVRPHTLQLVHCEDGGHCIDAERSALRHLDVLLKRDWNFV